jgi:hypothetical protein
MVNIRNANADDYVNIVCVEGPSDLTAGPEIPRVWPRPQIPGGTDAARVRTGGAFITASAD